MEKKENLENIEAIIEIPKKRKGHPRKYNYDTEGKILKYFEIVFELDVHGQQCLNKIDQKIAKKRASLDEMDKKDSNRQNIINAIKEEEHTRQSIFNELNNLSKFQFNIEIFFENFDLSKHKYLILQN